MRCVRVRAVVCEVGRGEQRCVRSVKDERWICLDDEGGGMCECVMGEV